MYMSTFYNEPYYNQIKVQHLSLYTARTTKNPYKTLTITITLWNRIAQHWLTLNLTLCKYLQGLQQIKRPGGLKRQINIPTIHTKRFVTRSWTPRLHHPDSNAQIRQSSSEALLGSGFYVHQGLISVTYL